MKIYFWVILLIIILTGSLVRLHNLDAESLWIDELFTLQSVKQNSLKEVITAVDYYEFHNPPFYYLGLYEWIKLVGDSEYSLRLFSVFFSFLSIIIIFLIGKEIFNVRTGLISALIFSLSIVEIVYSQEVRGYTMFSFFVLLSSYFFIKNLKNNENYWLVFYCLSSTLMIYILPFGLIILFLQNIYLFFLTNQSNEKKKIWFFGQLFIVLLFLPQLPKFVISLKENYFITFDLLVRKLGAPLIFNETGFTLSFLFAIFILVSILFLYFKAQLINLIKNFKFKKKYDLIIFSLFIALGLGYYYISPQLIKPSFLTRYTLFIMPFLYLVMAFLIAKTIKPIKIILIVIFLLLSLNVLNAYYHEEIKQNWKETSIYLDKNLKTEDKVIVCPIQSRLFCQDALNNGSIACPFDFNFEYYYKNYNELINSASYNNLQENYLSDNYWVVFSPDHKLGDICNKIIEAKPPLINKTFKRMQVYYFTK